jgi:Protein of unknown function (DUF2894)
MSPDSPAHTLRQHHIQALQRRAASHRGEARRVIEARLQQLRAAALADPEPAAPASTSAPTPPADTLTALLAHIAQHAAPPGQLKAVRDHSGTWARLRVDQRLTQSQAQVPSNAGPLNTQRLLHQALQLMREVSPAYLQHFMAHVDTLLALDAPAGPSKPSKGTEHAR